MKNKIFCNFLRILVFVIAFFYSGLRSVVGLFPGSAVVLFFGIICQKEQKISQMRKKNCLNKIIVILLRALSRMFYFICLSNQ